MEKKIKINMPLFIFICFALIMSWFMCHSIGYDKGYEKGRIETRGDIKEYMQQVVAIIENNYVPKSDDSSVE